MLRKMCCNIWYIKICDISRMWWLIIKVGLKVVAGQVTVN